jgi:hypothetical protein
MGRLEAANSPILVTSAHPGYAITNLQTSGPGEQKGLLGLLSAVLKPVLSQDAAHGALPTLFAATSPEAVARGYYGPDGPFELKGYPVSVPIPKRAQNEARHAPVEGSRTAYGHRVLAVRCTSVTSGGVKTSTTFN